MDSRLGILLIDDDPGITSALRLWAKLEEVALFTFESGEAFLKARDAGEFSFGPNSSIGEPITHALVDFTLPGMSGDQLIKRLSSFLPPSRLALITAKQFELQDRQEIALDQFRLMKKPFALSELDDFIFESDSELAHATPV